MKKVMALLLILLIGVMGIAFLEDRKQVLEEETVPSPTPSPTVQTIVVTMPPEPEETPDFYSTDSLLVVANKAHKLPDGYEPSDLTRPNVAMSADWTLREPAARALEEMFEAAEQDGVHLVLGSAYRPESYQRQLWNNYAAQYSPERADRISSRPGYSDHQTGLATDLCGVSDTSTDLSRSFEDTVEGAWLRDHAHEYGFIMRYPKDKEDITGYAYEPWHFRYIGVEYATKIYNRDVFYTFEEYFGIEGGDYAD
jgi:LAS superfamily LD-carboxypeptidase LdcB